MLRIALAALLVLVLPLSGCRHLKDWGLPKGQPIPEGDIVAIGRLDDQSSDLHMPDPDDLLGHGWFNAAFRISRVETGRLSGRVIRVRYYGHTWLRQDTRSRFRLRPSGNGDYFICKGRAGAVTDAIKKLGSPCFRLRLRQLRTIADTGIVVISGRMVIERWILAVAGLVGVFRIWRALQTGIVTEVSVIQRDDQPRLFWLLISVGIVMFGGFFYFAAFGDF